MSPEPDVRLAGDMILTKAPNSNAVESLIVHTQVHTTHENDSSVGTNLKIPNFPNIEFGFQSEHRTSRTSSWIGRIFNGWFGALLLIWLFATGFY